MIIGSAAHVVVCSCNHHARLVAADGRRTMEVCSKEHLRKLLDAGVEKGYITEVEVPEVRRQIDTCPLPEHEKDVESVDRVVAGFQTWIQANEKGDDEVTEHFHGRGSDLVH